MNSDDASLSAVLAAKQLARIEARLSRIEQHLRMAPMTADNPIALNPISLSSASTRLSSEPPGETEVEMEFVMGQKWFASAGILVLGIGAAFALSLPYPGLPGGLPPTLGLVLAGSIFVLAHLWRHSFELISSYLRAAGMALLFFATLRFYFFSSAPVLSTTSLPGKLVLLGVVGLNLAIALWYKSPGLVALGLSLGYATALMLDSAGFLFPTLTALSAFAVYATLSRRWPFIWLLGVYATYAAHFLWATNNPLMGNRFQFAQEPLASVFFILIYGLVLAIPSLFRPEPEEKDPLAIVSALLNAGTCYGLFLLHTVVSFGSSFVGLHLVASAVFLGVAITLWVIKRSQLSCFFYAIAGYLAMSVAILKTFTGSNVFVWLSVQSILVITTALWFRSRFIVVANFFMFLITVLGYMLTTKQETGISIGFGLVALLSARILNWQKERLQLRTEKMRNAYLVCVFVVFPYALYHLLPRIYVAVSWVGVAGIYYLLGWGLRNQKYRWLGHFTLVVTIFYVLVVAIIQLKPAQRILSYLVLGTVLVAISLIFTRQKARKRRES